MIDGPCSAPSSPPDTPAPTKLEAGARQLVGAAVGVGEERVAAVDQDVARLEMRAQVRDDAVHGRTGRHHQQDPARPFEHRHERSGVRAAIAAPLPAPSRNAWVFAASRS